MIHYVENPNVVVGVGFCQQQVSYCGLQLDDRRQWEHKIFDADCSDCIRKFREKDLPVCVGCGAKMTEADQQAMRGIDKEEKCISCKQKERQ